MSGAPAQTGDDGRKLLERMRDDAARNGDYQGAAELDALIQSERAS